MLQFKLWQEMEVLLPTLQIAATNKPFRVRLNHFLFVSDFVGAFEGNRLGEFADKSFS